MKTWLKAAIISILFHILLLFIRPLPVMNSEQQAVEIYFQVSDAAFEKQLPLENKPQKRKSGQKTIAKQSKNDSTEPEEENVEQAEPGPELTNEPDNESNPAETIQSDSTSNDTSFFFDNFHLSSFSVSRFQKQGLAKDSMSLTNLGTHQFQKVQPGEFSGLSFPSFKDSTYFSATPGPIDRIDRQLDRGRHGAGDLPSITGALASGAQQLQKSLKEEKPARFRRIPSHIELSVFNLLWEKEKAIDIDIYAHIDTSIHVSAEDLNRILKKMTTEGILRRKLVSPRNEFSLGMLGKGIEMSPKNQRNRVYEYECRVQPEHVIRYLNAVLYRFESNGSTLDDTLRTKLKKELKEKIIRTAACMED